MLQRHLLQPVKAAGLREVASAHVTLEQQKVIVRLFLAQQRTKLGWLPIPDARVVQAGGDQDVWVRRGLDVVHGRVALHVVVVLLLLRVPPLLKLDHREWDGLVQHCGEDIHEWDAHDDRLEEVRTHVDDRPHREAASGAAFDAELGRGGVLLADEVLGAGDEVGEGVLLLQKLSVLVPETAHFAATADVGHRKDEAAVDEGEAGGGEVGVVADLIGAVAVEQHRVATVQLHQILAVHQTDRHRRLVRRGGPQPERLVLGLLKAAQHRLHLLHLPLHAHHVHVHHGGGRGQRGVHQT
mmetsp:Transcript_29657/g.53120  ORF Transcript_29657/g.53120 Transcript_29657/m.53120 type:complete len:297 (-) Transcript_29657:758-1648(-)